MTTKTCSKCGVPKPLKDFYKDGAYTDGLKKQCKLCVKATPSQTTEKMRERADQVRLRNRQFMYDHYRSHPCVDCGEDDPIVLQSDHVAGTKFKRLAQMVNQTYSLKKITTELAKCETRCANCHTRRHADELGWYEGLS